MKRILNQHNKLTRIIDDNITINKAPTSITEPDTSFHQSIDNREENMQVKNSSELVNPETHRKFNTKAKIWYNNAKRMISFEDQKKYHYL